MPKEQKNQLPPHARIEKLEREIPIAKQLLAEDMQKLKDAKKEYEECLKAAARLHIVKKQVNKLHLAEVNWLQLIAQMEEELKLLKR
jgi:hypothetical protein